MEFNDDLVKRVFVPGMVKRDKDGFVTETHKCDYCRDIGFVHIDEQRNPVSYELAEKKFVQDKDYWRINGYIYFTRCPVCERNKTFVLKENKGQD